MTTDDYIAKLVDQAPTATAEQVAKVAAILLPVALVAAAATLTTTISILEQTHRRAARR